MSDIVINNIRINQKILAATTIFVRRVPYQTCIKNRATSDALQIAIASATKMFQRPRSSVATPVVTQVRRIRAKKTAKYTLFGTMWCSLVFPEVCPMCSAMWGAFPLLRGRPVDQIQQREKE